MHQSLARESYKLSLNKDGAEAVRFHGPHPRMVNFFQLLANICFLIKYFFLPLFHEFGRQEEGMRVLGCGEVSQPLL